MRRALARPGAPLQRFGELVKPCEEANLPPAPAERSQLAVSAFAVRDVFV